MASYIVSYLSSYFVTFLVHMVQEGMFVRETLALRVGIASYIVTFVMACSDLWAIHPRKCNHGKKEVSIVA
jgi:hypothetical protein